MIYPEGRFILNPRYGFSYPCDVVFPNTSVFSVSEITGNSVGAASTCDKFLGSDVFLFSPIPIALIPTIAVRITAAITITFVFSGFFAVVVVVS